MKINYQSIMCRELTGDSALERISIDLALPGGETVTGRMVCPVRGVFL